MLAVRHSAVRSLALRPGLITRVQPTTRRIARWQRVDAMRTLTTSRSTALNGARRLGSPSKAIDLLPFRRVDHGAFAFTKRNIMGLPSELRILRETTPKQAQQTVKEAIQKGEKETMTSKAVKEQIEKAAKAAQAEAQGAASTTIAKPKKPLWDRIKEEAVHYWQGTKLLGLEIKISSKLTWKLMHGGKLSRREHRQLKRTTADLLRLVPFLFFIIVPFMEFLLPVVLTLFPNMLPSTFEDKYKEDEKKRKLFKVRLEMAKFLQETIAEAGIPGESDKASHEFSDFFRKIRTSGEQASTEDILTIAKRFEDELTLDNLSRPQLVSMCRYMNINAFGTDTFLRYQIRHRMRQIKQDDKMIAAEGVEELSIPELQHACASRGIRTIGVSPGRLRDELNQWLDLHLNHQVPSTLLILSRAFSFTDRGLTTEEALQATLSSLPDNLVNEAELQVLELEGASTYKQKLEVLEQQQELIEDEAEEEEKERKAKEAEEKAKKEKEEEMRAQEAASERDQLLSDQQVAAEKKKQEEAEVRLTEEQLQELRNALAILCTKAGILEEREQLNEIKEDHEDYKEDIEELQEVTPKAKLPASARLGARLEKMLSKLDKELDSLEQQTSSDNLPRIMPNDIGQITTADLEEALRVIKHAPDNDSIKKVVKQLDWDKDGMVFLNHVTELAQQIPEGLGVVIKNIQEGKMDGRLRSDNVYKTGLLGEEKVAKVQQEAQK